MNRRRLPLEIPKSECHFQFVRSSGPGGQNVNKVNSKAVLRWNVMDSPSLSSDVRDRFLMLFGTKLTKNGELILTSDRFRDRLRNQEDCRKKLHDLVIKASIRKKSRKKTEPTRTTLAKRRTEKRKHSQKKLQRSRKTWD